MRNIRVIARVDIKGENVINTIQLEGLRIVGKPNVLSQKYYEEGVDEILLIDQVASLYQRGHLLDLTKKFAKKIFVPVTAGGGIASVEQAKNLLRAGADKVAVNTAATMRPGLISDLATHFGSQCIVVSIQAKKINEVQWEVFTNGGRERTGLDVFDWAKKAVDLGAGELLVTSIDRDGTRKGFDYKLMSKVSEVVNVPVIASGGFGKPEHGVELMNNSFCEALSVADYLHMNRGNMNDIKTALISANFRLRI